GRRRWRRTARSTRPTTPVRPRWCKLATGRQSSPGMSWAKRFSPHLPSRAAVFFCALLGFFIAFAASENAPEEKGSNVQAVGWQQAKRPNWGLGAAADTL